MLPGGVHGLTNPDGFRTAMEELLNGKDSIGDHVSQVCIAESQHGVSEYKFRAIMHLQSGWFSRILTKL
jgi:hypothetical protein